MVPEPKCSRRPCGSSSFHCPTNLGIGASSGVGSGDVTGASGAAGGDATGSSSGGAGATGGGGGATHPLNKIPPTTVTVNNPIRVLFISDVPFLFSKSSNFGSNQKGHQPRPLS